jgi:hypothetical protein
MSRILYPYMPAEERAAIQRESLEEQRLADEGRAFIVRVLRDEAAPLSERIRCAKVLSDLAPPRATGAVMSEADRARLAEARSADRLLEAMPADERREKLLAMRRQLDRMLGEPAEEPEKG